MAKFEIIEEYVNELGQTVRVFKYGKLSVKATYLNDPSPEALDNVSQSLRELFVKKGTPPEILDVMSIADGWRLLYSDSDVPNEVVESVCAKYVARVNEERNQDRD